MLYKIVMLSVFMLSVITLCVVMLSAVTLSVVMLSAIMLSIVMLSAIMLSATMLSVAMLSVVMLSAVTLSAIMLSVVMLSVIMPSVVMLSVAVQRRQRRQKDVSIMSAPVFRGGPTRSRWRRHQLGRDGEEPQLKKNRQNLKERWREQIIRQNVEYNRRLLICYVL